MDDVFFVASLKILLYSGLCMEHPRVCARCLEIHRLTSGETSCLLFVFGCLYFYYDTHGGFNLLHSGWELDERLLACQCVLNHASGKGEGR